MSDDSCFTESAAVLKISCYFKRQKSYYRKTDLIIIIKTKKAFVPKMSIVSFFTESAAVLKISPYFRKQISHYRKHDLIIILKKKKAFVHFCQIFLALLEVKQF
jgi:hypothetical protein